MLRVAVIAIPLLVMRPTQDLCEIVQRPGWLASLLRDPSWQ
jgi:hypothetical protein